MTRHAHQVVVVERPRKHEDGGSRRREDARWTGRCIEWGLYQALPPTKRERELREILCAKTREA